MLGLACQGAGAGGEVGELKVGTGGGLGEGHWGFFSWLEQGLSLARLPRALVLPMWLACQQAFTQMCEIVPTPYRKPWFCKSDC